jgi:hypothetical protein
VSAPFPSWNRSISTEIYLCHACSYHEIEGRNGTPGGIPALVQLSGSMLAAGGTGLHAGSVRTVRSIPCGGRVPLDRSRSSRRRVFAQPIFGARSLAYLGHHGRLLVRSHPKVRMTCRGVQVLADAELWDEESGRVFRLPHTMAHARKFAFGTLETIDAGLSRRAATFRCSQQDVSAVARYYRGGGGGPTDSARGRLALRQGGERARGGAQTRAR